MLGQRLRRWPNINTALAHSCGDTVAPGRRDEDADIHVTITTLNPCVTSPGKPTPI